MQSSRRILRSLSTEMETSDIARVPLLGILQLLDLLMKEHLRTSLKNTPETKAEKKLVSSAANTANQGERQTLIISLYPLPSPHQHDETKRNGIPDKTQPLPTLLPAKTTN